MFDDGKRKTKQQKTRFIAMAGDYMTLHLAFFSDGHFFLPLALDEDVDGRPPAAFDDFLPGFLLIGFSLFCG
jgi:hypothetical protein